MMSARLKMFIGGWEMWEVEVAMNGIHSMDAVQKSVIPFTRMSFHFFILDLLIPFATSK
jgi:hypothetical protein